MKVSYKWLQSYFEKDLPKPEEIAEILTFHSFEVESVEDVVSGDIIFDIDVLPNRAHDCLSHLGIAKEISVLTDIPFRTKKEQREDQIEQEKTQKPSISVSIEDDVACRRYIGSVIRGVKVGPSPEWLIDRLEAIGQKSINNIVDATNFVMFNIGQPLHAFDLDKLSGSEIIVRKAREGEKITTLDNQEVELDENILVIADSQEPIAIAGIKGGKKAEVNENTTNIVLEAANFHPTGVRKTSRRLNILTDSSKRFENELTPEFADKAMQQVVNIIVDIASGNSTTVEGSVDIYKRMPNKYKIGISTENVNKVLGKKLSDKDVKNIFDRFGLKVEEVKDPIQKILTIVQEYKGVPYKYGASIIYDAPKYFDCSSFIAYLFVQVGIAIPRMTIDQYVFGQEVSENNIQPGDLVFSNTREGNIHYESVEFLSGTHVASGVDHCGLYLGDGNIMHASRYNKDGIIVEKLSDSKKFKDIVGYRRVVASAPRYVVTVPHARLDLRIEEDLIEEIGRVYGYENISPKLPKLDVAPEVHKELYYKSKIRNTLVGMGFSEVYNYSFVESGEVELRNPLDKTKKFLRVSLSDGLLQSLEKNVRNAPLLGLSEVKLFEFGKVFTKDREYMALALAVSDKKAKATLEDAQKKISDTFGVSIEGTPKGNMLEIDFERFLEKLPDAPDSYGEVLPESSDTAYRSASSFPFVLRDVAVWASEGVESSEVEKLINENAGDLLVQKKLFDVFKKDGRVSYAFNLVFQSHEKTLTDEEVGKIMKNIEEAINKKNWEVR